jgi:hypothetical protein
VAEENIKVSVPQFLLTHGKRKSTPREIGIFLLSRSFSCSDIMWCTMLRQAIRNLPGVPLLIKLNTDLEDWWFDFRYGTDTAADRVEQTQKGWETDPTNHTYLPTRPKCVRRAFGAMPVKDLRDYTFIDFGSGKGRALLMAADLHFQSLLGIELRKELHDQAVQNLRNRRKVLSSRIVSMNINALDFEYPNGKLVLFFSNPFGEQVLRSVLENLGRSLQSNFRDVLVVFAMYVPDFMLIADTMPFLSLEKAGHGFRIFVRGFH